MNHQPYRWILPLMLGLAWLPALFVAWWICPPLLKMYGEFEVPATATTSLLLPRMWWLTPSAMILLVTLATWLRSTATIWIAILAAIMAAAVPVGLWLFQLQSLATQLR